jgi:hypothetical protein
VRFERTRLRARGKKTRHGDGCYEFSYFCVHDSNEPKWNDVEYILLEPILSVYWGNPGFMLRETLRSHFYCRSG